MSEVLSHWPVVVRLPLEGDDHDGDGRLTEAAVARLFAAGRHAYFALCTTIEAPDVEVLDVELQRGPAEVPDGGVSVSISVVEVFPDSFTMHTRVRPAEGPGVAATGQCTVFPGDSVSPEMRAELIALAHGARHLH